MHHGLLRTILGLCGGKGATLGFAEVLYRGCSHWLCHAKRWRSHGHRKNFRGRMTPHDMPWHDMTRRHMPQSAMILPVPWTVSWILLLLVWAFSFPDPKKTGRSCRRPSRRLCGWWMNPAWDLTLFALTSNSIAASRCRLPKQSGQVALFSHYIHIGVDKKADSVPVSFYGFQLFAKNDWSGASLEAEIKKELSHPTPVRMWAIAKAFDQGMNVEEVHELTSTSAELVQLVRSRRFPTSGGTTKM